MAGIRGTGPNGAINLSDIIRYQNIFPGADELRDENRASASLMQDELAPELKAIDARLARRGIDPGVAAVPAISSSRPAPGGSPESAFGDRIRRLQAMTPEERSTYFRQEQENQTVSDGPPKGSVLQKREYAPDNVPIEDMTPEQRRLSTYVPGAATSGGAPRAVRGGRFVIDSSSRDGDGAPVPRAPDYNAVAEGRNSVRQKAAAYGIDVTKYDPENPGDQAALETDVRREEQRHHRLTNSATGLYETRELPDGGHRYAPNERGQKMVADKNREMLLNNQWSMYSREAREAGLTFEDFAKKYDEEGVAGLRSVTQALRNNQGDNRRDNVRQRAENANMAQLMGTTPGHVAAYNELQNAAASGDPLRLQAALFGMGNIYPGSGMGNAGVMVGQQYTDRYAADTVAGGREPKKTPVQRASEDRAAIASMPFSPEAINNWGLTYTGGLNGAPANPRDRSQHIVSNATPAARQVALNPGRSPEEESGLRDWTREFHNTVGAGGSTYEKFRKWALQLGLNIDAPEERQNAMRLYQKLTGNNPSPGMFLDPIAWFTGTFSGSPASSAQASPSTQAAPVPGFTAPPGR